MSDQVLEVLVLLAIVSLVAAMWRTRPRGYLDHTERCACRDCRLIRELRRERGQ